MSGKVKDILIISPSLEPKYCGISDYTFVLINLLLKSRLNVVSISIYDKYVNDYFFDGKVIRIPASFSNCHRVGIIKEYFRNNAPNLIIFNFESYGYSKIGLPLWLFSTIHNFSSGYKIFIFHELWQGNFISESLKSKVLGFLQKGIIKGLISKAKPELIYVTSVISKNILFRNNINASLLPVFSNISIEKYIKKENYTNEVRYLFFGSGSFPFQPDICYAFFSHQLTKINGKIKIICIGKEKSIVNTLINSNLINDDRLEIVEVDLLPSRDLSILLQNVDYGITYYLPQFWTKSGVIAAMLSHGLKVISISRPINLGQLSNNCNIHSNILYAQTIIENNILLKRRVNKVDLLYNKKIFSKLKRRIFSILNQTSNEF